MLDDSARIFFIIIGVIGFVLSFFGKSKNDSIGQREYESAERAAKGLAKPNPGRDRNPSDTSEKKTLPVNRGEQNPSEIKNVFLEIEAEDEEHLDEEEDEANEMEPNTDPEIKIYHATIKARTLLDLPGDWNKANQLILNGNELMITDALRKEAYCSFTLPGKLIDHTTIWVNEDQTSKDYFAFLVAVCDLDYLNNVLLVLGIRQSISATTSQMLSVVYQVKVKGDQIGHVFQKPNGAPRGVMIFSSESSKTEFLDIEHQEQMESSFGYPIVADRLTAQGSEFFTFNGANLERWNLTGSSVDLLDRQVHQGYVGNAFFENTRATFQSDIDDLTFYTGTGICWPEKGKEIAQDKVVARLGNNFFATETALYYAAFGKTSGDPRLIKVLDRPVIPMLLANIYDEQESYWAVFADLEQSAVYVADVEVDKLSLIMINQFKGKVTDVTMTLDEEYLIIYTDKQTLIVSNLASIPSTEVDIAEKPVITDPYDMLGNR